MTMYPLNLSSVVGVSAVVQAVQEGHIYPLCGRVETLNCTDFIMFGGMTAVAIAAVSAFFMGYIAMGIGTSVLLLPLAIGLLAVRKWADLRSLEEISSDLRLSNDMFRMTQQALSVNVEEFHHENVELRETRNALNQEVSQLSKENGVLCKTSQTLTQNIKDMGEEINRYEKANREHEVNNQKLSEQIDQISSENQTLSESIKQYKLSNTEYAALNKKFSQKLEFLKSIKEELTDEVTKLSKIVNGKDSFKTYLKKINKVLEKQKLENNRQAESNRIFEKNLKVQEEYIEELQRTVKDVEKSLKAYDLLSRNLLTLSAEEDLPPKMRKVVLEFALKFNILQENLKVHLEGEATQT